MNRQLRSLLLLTASLLCSIAGPLLAQSGLGSITGSVLDQTGGILAGASVRVEDKSTGAVRTAVSNEVGLFNVPSDSSGHVHRHRVTPGFQDSAGREPHAEFVPAALTDKSRWISRSARPTPSRSAPSATLLQLDSGVRSDTVQADQVHDMPLQGRNWASLLKVIPGSNPINSTALNGREYSATGYSRVPHQRQEPDSNTGEP